ncbi:MAG TPA: DnaA N-terminal domain-containing protein [Alphaproteobacteria bacterium]|nr:DnaA N-terminal domain-containing protein [Alphaproteobacteria bacterium]
MSSLLINEPPLQVLPTLAHRIGLNEALMLQQVHYWLNPKLNRNIFEKRHWVHNTYRQWQAQFPFWSQRTIQRILLSLEEKSLLLAFLKNDFQKTKHYTIDYDQLRKMELISTKILSRGARQTDVMEPSSIEENSSILSEKDHIISNFSASRQIGTIESATLSTASRQIGMIDHASLSDRALQNGVTETSLIEENSRILSEKGPIISNFYVPRQIGTIDRATLSTPSRQIGTIDHDKLACLYIDTETTNRDNLPPLTPPSNFLSGLNWEEEENSKEDPKSKSLQEENPRILSEKGPIISHLSTPRQIGTIERATLSTPSRQIGTIDHDKLACLYIDTETTNRDNLPPLTPPSDFLSGLNWEEEENPKKDPRSKSLQNDLLQAWVDVWNETIQSKFLSSRPILLNSSRIQKFRCFMEEISIEDLEGWRRYCQKIHQSRFLMGRNATGFRVTLDWALNPLNAFKILEGAIYDKPREEGVSLGSSEGKFIEKPWSEYVENLKQHCLDHDYSDRWFKACKVLAAHLGQVTFENWFKAMRPEEQDDGMVCLTVESPFMRDYIKTHYISALEKAFSAAFPEQTRFKIQAGTDPPWEPQ